MMNKRFKNLMDYLKECEGASKNERITLLASDAAMLRQFHKDAVTFVEEAARYTNVKGKLSSKQDRFIEKYGEGV
jgi:hypothetical protein